MIAALDAIEDDALREAVFGALAGIDTIHREALHRLVRLFKEGVLEQVVTDPAIKTLMGMYDLLPEPEPACQRVWDFVGNETARDVPGSAVPGPAVDADRSEDLPHWSPAPIGDPPGEGETLICRMEEGVYVLARIDGQHFVFSVECGVHLAPMQDGRLENLSWICPHGPGCIYDIRNGARLGGGPGLECLPVRTDDSGRILIGFGVPFEPKLPAF
jgi:nitrite reductase/ring-hydroxylating ferredoxin subunit